MKSGKEVAKRIARSEMYAMDYLRSLAGAYRTAAVVVNTSVLSKSYSEAADKVDALADQLGRIIS